MRRWGRLVVAATAAALAAGLAPLASAPAAGAVPPTPTSAGASLASGPRHPDRPVARLVVRMKDGSTASPRVRGAAATLAGLPAVPLLGRRTGGRTLLGLGAGLPVADAWKVARELEKRPDVLWAEPDLWVYPAASPVVPNDPGFANQWALWADSGYSTHVSAAWPRTTGRSDVVVAVLDTGLTAHPDITTSVTAPRSTDPIVKGYDFVALDDVSITSTPIRRAWTSNDGDGRDPDPTDPGDWISAADNQGLTAHGWFQGCADPNDPNASNDSSWHGTFVTGVIAAKPGNKAYGSGAAPGVKVQPVRVLGKCGGYSSDIDDAITWASGGHIDGVPDNATPAAVVSLSLGGPGTCLPSTQAAIDGARGRGATVVVAAGNEGVAADSGGSQPADCSGVVTVVAVGKDGSRPSWSNYGPVTGSLVVAAPGGNDLGGVYGVTNTGLTTLGTPTFEYGFGTSFATPHVSAIVALLQSLRAGRGRYSPAQIETLLSGMASPTAGCPAGECGAGAVDVGTTGQNLPTYAPEAPTNLLADVSTTSVDLRWTPGDTGGRATTYTVQRSTGGPWTDVATGLTGSSTTVTGLTTGTAYSFRVVATNSAGSATSDPVGPETPSAFTAPGLAVAGGVASMTATWAANPDTAGPVVYRLRYRKVGDLAWTTSPDTAAGATSAALPTPVDASAGGTWEVQIQVVTGGPWAWSDSRTAVVRAYAAAFTSSSTVLRPYRDGFQDTVTLRVATNRTGGSSGTARITDSLGRTVRSWTLGTASSWTWSWNATTASGARVANGSYTVRVSLRDPSGALADVVQAKPVTVAVTSSQAARPTITVSSASLFPYRDAYLDTTSLRATTTVPATLTWKLVRSGRTYWSATYSPRLGVTTTYAGARTGGGTVPAGIYTLYAYAKGGEGSTVSSSRSLTVSSKKRVKHAFTRTWSPATALRASVPAAASGGAFADGAAAVVPGGAMAMFAASMPATVSPYSSLALRISATSQGSVRPRAGYYLGPASNPETLRYQKLSTTGGTLPAPTSTAAAAGGVLRWWVQNTAGGTDFRVGSVTATGYYYTLA